MSAVQPGATGDRVRPRLVLVLSSPRSGSTLLGKVLASTGRVVDVGELSRLARRYDKGCWCGEPYARCRVWAPVLAGETTGDQLAPAGPPALPRRLRWWAFAHLLGGRRLGRANPTVEQYLDHLATVTLRLSSSSPGAAIVDTSKESSHLIAMTALPAEVHLIRLLRDPRGVVWSRQRKLVATTGRVHRRYLVQDALSWSGIVLLGWVMARGSATASSQVVWYDDLVAAPRAVVGSLATIPALRSAAVDLDEDGRLRVREDHAVGGNVRFRKRNPWSDEQGRSDRWAPVELRLDERWRRELGHFDRALVAALTAPARFLVRHPRPMETGRIGDRPSSAGTS